MLLEAEGVSVAGPAGQEPLLTGPVSVSLAAGDVLALGGASGSGKTTLLRALAMLEARAEGEVRLRGRVPADAALPAFRREVVYVPQTPPRFPLTVEASLRAVFALRSAAGEAYDPAAARGLLDRLLLPADVLGRRVPDLSGGEAQRVGFVRALLLRPAVLLLDEPTSALDRLARGALAALLGEWLSAGERAALIVTHEPAHFETLITRRLHLERGRAASEAPAS